jgi:phage/plasmid-associated DNA primase
MNLTIAVLMFTLAILDTILRKPTNMTSKANPYQARVYEAYCAWCKQGKTQESLDSIAESFDVDPWHIEREHRTALDLY